MRKGNPPDPGRIKIRLLVVAMLVLGLSVGGSTIAAAGAADGQKAESAKKKKKKKKKKKQGAQGPAGPTGPAGVVGPAGPQGPAGSPGDSTSGGATVVDQLPGSGFDVTNPSCSLTPDGVECGPYADGGAAGGSLFYDGLNGQPLSAVQNLVFTGRYTATGDTGGVGVPYLRIFLEGDTHDAIFSPNTQPPDPQIQEGIMHTWVATSGVWRYDDDAGAGGQYGVNGAPFSQVVADHGTETISGIYITTGFSAGQDLNSLIRSMEVNGADFEFGS